MSLRVPLQTIGDAIHRRICPLYSIDERGRIYMHGSAIPFRSGGIAFLITAGHVCVDPQRRSIPLFTWGVTGERILEGTRLTWEQPSDQAPDIDIALIALSDEDIGELDGVYQFSDPPTTSTIQEKTPGIHYMVTGYPFARNRVRLPDPSHLSIPSLATYLITGDIRPVAGLSLQGKYDASHFAIYFERHDIPTLGGGKFNFPRPRGMSGGGVWKFEIDIRRRYATIPQLVGILIEHHSDKNVFVASRIQLAIPLVHDLIKLLPGAPSANVNRSDEATDKT